MHANGSMMLWASERRRHPGTDAYRVAGIGAIVWLAMTVSETGSLDDSPVFTWFLTVLGIAASISVTLSNLSFCLYAAKASPYWEWVIGIASHHDDVEPFNNDLVRRGLLGGR